MKDNFVKCLPLVLKHEGGWSNHPSDPGGATMRGVTLATFRRYYGNNMTKDDLRGIRYEQLQHIYKDGYWDVCKCDELPYGVDYAMFDFAVNSGPRRAVSFLQEIVGSAADGILGPRTLNAVKGAYDHRTIVYLCDNRLAFLRSLANWRVFGTGWENRVIEMEAIALKMFLDGRKR